MSGAMRRIGEYLGLLEDTGRYVDEYDTGGDDRYDGDDEHTASHQAVPARGAVRRDSRPAPVADLADRRRPVAPVASVAAPAAGPAGSVAELSRITTVHPRTYNEARTVGEHFRDGIPVMLVEEASSLSDDDNRCRGSRTPAPPW